MYVGRGAVRFGRFAVRRVDCQRPRSTHSSTLQGEPHRPREPPTHVCSFVLLYGSHNHQSEAQETSRGSRGRTDGFIRGTSAFLEALCGRDKAYSEWLQAAMACRFPSSFSGPPPQPGAMDLATLGSFDIIFLLLPSPIPSDVHIYVLLGHMSFFLGSTRSLGACLSVFRLMETRTNL